MFGGGDCALRSSKEPANEGFPDPDPVVPSDVCMLRIAAGRPDGGDCCDGAFLDFDLKRNDMTQSMLATSTTSTCSCTVAVAGKAVFCIGRLLVDVPCPCPLSNQLFLQTCNPMSMDTKDWR